jgi:hypothetical protein
VKLTNDYGIPDLIYQAELKDVASYTRRTNISVSELTSPPRQIALRRLHENRITEDVFTRSRSFAGKAVHYYLEHHTDGIHELYLRMTYEDWVISGRIDRLFKENGQWVAEDFKYVNPYATRDGYKQEWVEQLNLYRLLLTENRLPCDRLQTVPIYVGWDDDSMAWKGYPQKWSEVMEVPMWSLVEAEDFLEERFRLHREAQASSYDDKLPLCTSEERWWGWDKKLKKEVSKRCRKYCNVAPFCSQFKEESGGQVSS